jgi:hypothetical protein
VEVYNLAARHEALVYNLVARYQAWAAINWLGIMHFRNTYNLVARNKQ